MGGCGRGDVTLMSLASLEQSGGEVLYFTVHVPLYICVYMRVCMYVYMYVCVYVYIYICTHVCMCT